MSCSRQQLRRDVERFAAMKEQQGAVMTWCWRCVLTVAMASVAFCLDLPDKTRLEVRLNETLSSDTSQTAQPFAATLDRSASVGGKVILSKGAQVAGVVRFAESTRNYSRPGELDLQVTSIKADGKTYEVVAAPVVVRGKIGRLNPNTGRPYPNGRRKQDAVGAAIDAATGGARANAQTIPGTNSSVGPESSRMQVVLPVRSKLAFTVVRGS